MAESSVDVRKRGAKRFVVFAAVGMALLVALGWVLMLAVHEYIKFAATQQPAVQEHIYSVLVQRMTYDGDTIWLDAIVRTDPKHSLLAADPAVALDEAGWNVGLVVTAARDWGQTGPESMDVRIGIPNDGRPVRVRHQWPHGRVFEITQVAHRALSAFQERTGSEDTAEFLQSAEWQEAAQTLKELGAILPESPDAADLCKLIVIQPQEWLFPNGAIWRVHTKGGWLDTQPPEDLFQD
jgi:hypothetical protein